MIALLKIKKYVKPESFYDKLIVCRTVLKKKEKIFYIIDNFLCKILISLRYKPEQIIKLFIDKKYRTYARLKITKFIKKLFIKF